MTKSSIEKFIWAHNKRNNSDEPPVLLSPSSSVAKTALFGAAKRFDSTFDIAPISGLGTNFQSHMVSGEISFLFSDISDQMNLTTGLWFSKNTYDIVGFRNERQSISFMTVSTSSGTFTTRDTITIVDFQESSTYSATAVEIPFYLEFYNERKLITYYAALGATLKLRSVERDFSITKDVNETGLSSNLIMEFGFAFNLFERGIISFVYNIDTQANIRARIRF